MTDERSPIRIHILHCGSMLVSKAVPYGGGVNLKKESAVMEAAGAEDTAADMNVMPGEMEVSANIKIVFSMGD